MMKNTVIRFGLYSSALMIGMFYFFWLFLADLDYGIQEVLGYANIILAMTFVYFGIRHYRDKVNNGVISFGTAVKIGTLIVLVPSLLFGLADVLYVTAINPGFAESYYDYQIQQYASLPPAEYNAKVEEMEAQKDMFNNPYFLFVVMFVTVFLIGFVATMISSVFLQKKKAVAASS